MTFEQLRPTKVLRGPLFAEPVEVLVTVPMGDAVKLIGRGLQTGKAMDIILTDEKLKLLETTPDTEPFDGDAHRFRLGIEAMRLQLAFEYDPYFSLSIARVDPLPHQLEAVYDYFLRLPRIRFLLADDPGAGKTIMAGLLIKELKIRGLIKRVLIITPASLCFQWQREMKDKFREQFDIVRSDILRANYGSNPWQEKNQVVTSVSWVSVVEDAKESLLRSRWDLIIVDEAHKMSAATRDKKTLAYQLGEQLSQMTDHYLLMTATPHKGDPDHFCLFLELLDRDVYGDVKSLEEAMRKQEAPFYLRRVKEALVSFPDPDTGKVFNVLGDVFPANLLEKMIRDMYAHNQMDEEIIKQRIVEQVDRSRFERITNSTLEGLAKRELNLSAIIGKSAEAKERRLVPEVIENFFTEGAPIAGLQPREVREDSHIYRVGRVPRPLWPIGERLEPRFGKLGREYKNVVFDKLLLPKDPTLEWVTPGHPLFEAVREDVIDQTTHDLQRGSVFYDLNCKAPYRLDFFAASIKDGRDHQLHRRLFAVQIEPCPSPAGSGTVPLAHPMGEGSGVRAPSFIPQPSALSLSIKQPTVLLDLALAPKGTPVPNPAGLPDRAIIEQFLVQNALTHMLAETTAQRVRETATIAKHLEISLGELIHRQNLRLAELLEMMQAGDTSQPVAANLKQTEDRIDELNARLEGRRAELQQERECMMGDIQHLGKAWVLPHPDRESPKIAPMVADPEIERIAVQFVIKHEESEGRVVESVEKDNRGFDLISRKPHPEDPKTAIDVRFIEVKGRSDVGEIAVTSNEYNTAKRLKNDYWLYVVFHCATQPTLNILRDPSTLDWQPVTKIEQYRLRQDSIARPVELKENSLPYRTSLDSQP